MLVERLTFQVKYGEGDKFVALMREMTAIMPPELSKGRLYTDATGTMFTVQLETEFADWPAYAAAMVAERESYADPRFQQLFSRMQALTERGERQVLNFEVMV